MTNPLILIFVLANTHFFSQQQDGYKPEYASVSIDTLSTDIPEGYEVRHVGGRKAAGAAAARVDTHHLEGQNKTRLVVNLSGRGDKDMEAYINKLEL